jgi:hypothetical protein
MWILVLLMVTGQGPMFNAHPKPMSESECAQAKLAVEADLTAKFEKANIKDMTFTIRCVQWGPAEAAE